MAKQGFRVTIVRKKWYRGLGGSGSALRRADGMKCCLGFAVEAAGASPESITGIGSPSQLFRERGLKPLPTLLDGDDDWDSRVCGRLMVTNDAMSISDYAREAEIIKLGASAGIEFEFVE